jgi:hypothetical protein
MRLPIVPVLLLALSWQAPAFAADPTVPECLTASNTSAKLRADHKLRQARAQLLVCVSASCPAEVRTECVRRMDQVVASLPSIVFEVKDGAGRDVSAIQIRMDGEVVAERLDGSAIDVDPGEHRFTFDAAGQPPVTQTLLVHEGDKSRREWVVLGGAGAARSEPSPPIAAKADVGEARVPDGGGMRTLGLLAGGAGVAGLVVGGVFGGLAFSSWGAASSACPSHTGCSAQATSDRSNAVTFSTVSDVGFIAGGALLALGVTLTLTAPRAPTAAVSIDVAPGWIGTTGWF